MATESKAHPDIWCNRILRYEIVSVESLLANENNWRIHPKPQQDTLVGCLNDIGIVKPILINLRTSEEWPADKRGIDTMVDGHQRVSLCLQKGQPTFPAVFTDLTPAEEVEALTLLDTIPEMSVPDTEQLEYLLPLVESEDLAVQNLLAEIEEEIGGLGLKEVGGTKRELGEKSKQIKPVLYADEVEMFENAIQATGEKNRGRAIIEICKFYLGNGVEAG